MMKMKTMTLIILTFSFLSLICTTQADHHFDKTQSLSIIQDEIAKKEEMNLLTIHVQLGMISEELQKKWDSELFQSTLKYYPPLFKKMDHYATVEAIAPLYQDHKSEIDELVKKSLEKKDQKEFHRRLQLALKVMLEGNG
jgi:hypothetical protein